MLADLWRQFSDGANSLRALRESDIHEWTRGITLVAEKCFMAPDKMG
jgi:hypothetical protein